MEMTLWRKYFFIYLLDEKFFVVMIWFVFDVFEMFWEKIFFFFLLLSNSLEERYQKYTNDQIKNYKKCGKNYY